MTIASCYNIKSRCKKKVSTIFETAAKTIMTIFKIAARGNRDDFENSC